MTPARDPQQPDRPPERKPTPRPRFAGLYLFLILLLVWLWLSMFSTGSQRTIDYSQFKTYLARGEVERVVIEENVEVRGRIAPKTGVVDGIAEPVAREGQPPLPKDPFPFNAEWVPDEGLVAELQQRGVPFTGERQSFLSQFFWGWILPLSLMLLLFLILFRRSSGPSLLSMGKSRARLVADKDTGVTFDDVAGCEEAKEELQEVVDFLRNPDRYRRLGAKIPKGVLLVGPPGTGKTLLGRAVAGEAGVPFFSLSGSDFVEMFVGVGAARVRDLFVQAVQKAPCIIFIDELDAIGRQRGVHLGVVNDEREQTLNQLLVEMDGFETNKGVIVLAATNRPDVLDRALLRPGRFDRQVLVDSPDVDGREAILKVHARNKPLADVIDLRRIAQATPGFSGADLANAMNEAALLAARRGSPVIEQKDLEDAVEKVVAGPERKTRRMSSEDKKRVAFHEVGHALVTYVSGGRNKVHKISVVPRGRAALGYTMQVPEQEQFMLTERELRNDIRGLLGGRAAEELVFGEVSTGAANDLDRATTIARQMVAAFGMSKEVGLSHHARPAAPRFLDPDMTQLECSDETARVVDHEVKRILDEAYADALDILKRRKTDLDRIAGVLLERESIDGRTFERLLAGEAA